MTDPEDSQAATNDVHASRMLRDALGARDVFKAQRDRLQARVAELEAVLEGVRSAYDLLTSAGIPTNGVEGHGKRQELTLTQRCLRLCAVLTDTEARLAEECRLNGMGSEREARLMAKVKELESEARVAHDDCTEDQARLSETNHRLESELFAARDEIVHLTCRCRGYEAGLEAVRAHCAKLREALEQIILRTAGDGTLTPPVLIQIARRALAEHSTPRSTDMSTPATHPENVSPKSGKDDT